MSWLTVVLQILSYSLLPLKLLFNALLIVLAPVLHLGSYILTGFIMPLRLLAKFETLYIYLGVAAVIGLITGSLLHISSTVLVSIFGLAAAAKQPETGRTAASVRAAREQKKLEGAWESSIAKGEFAASMSTDPSTKKRQEEWLEAELTKRREDHGLLGQTILEDDSEDMF